MSFKILKHDYNPVLLERGWKTDDARQFLPIGIATRIVITANLREWRHIFELRTQKAAHWEIRIAMLELLPVFKEMFKPVFDDINGGQPE